MILEAGGRRLHHSRLFIGREWELAQLQAGLDEMRADRGKLFVLTGEAGIGNSRLAAILISR